MNNVLIALIGYYSAVYGIDPKLSLAVAKHESQLNPKAVGKKGELGLFQLMPSSFPEVNKKELIKPEVNIQMGIRYLAWVKKYCSHKKDNTFLVCYNYGIEKAKNVKHPKLFPYYKLVMKEYKNAS